MRPGAWGSPEVVTMKKMRSASSRGKITGGCSNVVQLEFEDGELDLVGAEVI